MTSSQPFVLDDVKMLLAMLNSAPKPDVPDVEATRQGYRALKAMTEPEPRRLEVIRDLVCPGPAGEIRLRLYDPRKQRDPSPIVVFFHGGGFVIGDLETHNSLCTELAAQLDLPVVAVDYRLAPEAPFPAAPDDAEAATRWLAESPDALGRTVTGLVTIGGSAGGNLAAVTARALIDRPGGAPMLLQVLLYPATDASTDGSIERFAEGWFLSRATMEWFMANYQPEPDNPRAFPLLANAEGMCPSIVATAGLCILQDQGRRLAAKLVEAGVETVYLHFAGLTHDFTTSRRALPSGAAATDRIIAAIKLMLPRV